MVKKKKIRTSVPFIITPSRNQSNWNDIDPEKIWTLYKKHGALLFRGFKSSSQADFVLLTDKYCERYIINGSPERDMINKSRGIQTVNKGRIAFPLHAEMCHKPWRPDVCWFWCRKPPPIGGETTICDGIEIAKKLPRDVKNLFKKKQLLYKTNIPGFDPLIYYFEVSQLRKLQFKLKNSPFSEFYKLNRDGTIAEEWVAPGLYQPKFSKKLAFGNFLLFSATKGNIGDYPAFGTGERISELIIQIVDRVSERLTHTIQWSKNDLLMLDNTRFMHGRKLVYKNTERVILSRFGYLKETLL